MATYEYQVTVTVLRDADSQEEAYAGVEEWLENNVYDWGSIQEV